MTASVTTSILDIVAVDAEAGSSGMNQLAATGTPFLFVVDAWADRWVVLETSEAVSRGILWDFEGSGPLGKPQAAPRQFYFSSQKVPLDTYAKGFAMVRRAQESGETWLANLSYPSPLDTDLTLNTLARCAQAPFRLAVPAGPVVFSPERFVRIRKTGRIESYPMKGTIDADLPNAADRILADEKETAEHITIVDLIRNDLGMVAQRVNVPRFRYLSEVRARNRRLLQVSSEVTGELGTEWCRRTGTILRRLLPAGSVTGAPKKRTGEIIRKAEGYDRGWYTGVFGVFNGKELDSAVAIRYVEHATDGTLVYKSGGGITIYSDMDSEYAELEAKVYAPFG